MKIETEDGEQSQHVSEGGQEAESGGSLKAEGQLLRMLVDCLHLISGGVQAK